jgi:predicted permease
MPILCLAHVPIPGMITSLAEIVGSANAFLSMLMIGVGFRLAANKTQIGGIIRVLSVRFGFAFIFALICYYLLPYALEVRKALILLVFSPVGTAVPAFTGEMKSDIGLSSAINSISIICSILFMVLILLFV